MAEAADTASLRPPSRARHADNGAAIQDVCGAQGHHKVGLTATVHRVQSARCAPDM
jgi:hypothetical protein